MLQPSSVLMQIAAISCQFDALPAEYYSTPSDTAYRMVMFCDEQGN